MTRSYELVFIPQSVRNRVLFKTDIENALQGPVILYSHHVHKVISVFVGVGIIFIPLGLASLSASEQVVEVVQDYHQDCVPPAYRNDMVGYIQNPDINKTCTLSMTNGSYNKTTPTKLKRMLLPAVLCLSHCRKGINPRKCPYRGFYDQSVASGKVTDSLVALLAACAKRLLVEISTSFQPTDSVAPTEPLVLSSKNGWSSSVRTIEGKESIPGNA
ncbi:hypothetical protein KSS87_018663 [Heliosperma pusillum]|nr:hypothetical protein KSS87_018663 [Heliosperma pusillum]